MELLHTTIADFLEMVSQQLLFGSVVVGGFTLLAFAWYAILHASREERLERELSAAAEVVARWTPGQAEWRAALKELTGGPFSLARRWLGSSAKGVLIHLGWFFVGLTVLVVVSVVKVARAGELQPVEEWLLAMIVFVPSGAVCLYVAAFALLALLEPAWNLAFCRRPPSFAATPKGLYVLGTMPSPLSLVGGAFIPWGEAEFRELPSGVLVRWKDGQEALLQLPEAHRRAVEPFLRAPLAARSAAGGPGP